MSVGVGFFVQLSFRLNLRVLTLLLTRLSPFYHVYFFTEWIQNAVGCVHIFNSR